MKFGMKNEKHAMRKSGVSIITVLLFMLVATIAATATYKWITSEGRSSASRLRQSEAYQSAIAGIENTRAWMTFHANDVGALVRQYLVQSTPRKPINLDSRLRSFQRAGQDYHVWLTGVNVENSSFKLKILSSGESPNGSRHNESAILNVDGLYQVTIPQIQHHSTIKFNYAYYGGSYKSRGAVTMTSGVVNGNWEGNPPTTERNWVVTGNVTLSGNDLTVGQTACIGGNASIQNAGITTTDLYVGGDFSGVIKKASGNVYFNGDVKQEQTGKMNIDGSVTLNGFYESLQDNDSHGSLIKGNLCVDTAGAVVASGIANGVGGTFQVNGNVWMPGSQNVWYGSIDRSGCMCNIYSKAYPTEGQLLRTESCTGSWDQYPEKGVLIGCASKRLTASSDDISSIESSYGKIILGDSSSKVYIRGAIRSSAYNSNYANSNGTNRKITENSNYKKNCSAKISSKDYWKKAVYPEVGEKRFPSDEKDICGSWSELDWPLGASAYQSVYTDGWGPWGGNSYWPYKPAVTEASDKYSIFSSGSDVVTFGLYNLQNWKQFSGDYTYGRRTIHLECTDYCKPGPGEWYNFGSGDVHSRDFSLVQNEINNRFVSPTQIGAYMVGGDIFYNPITGAYNGYNYDMDAGKATGSPYCKKNSSDTYRPTCGTTPWFKSSGTVSSSTDLEREFTCAENVESDCHEIWGDPADGCDDSHYFVADPLITAYNDYEPYSRNGCANSIHNWNKDTFDSLLNWCWDKNIKDTSLRKTNLYNDYLVVHITGSAPGDNYDANSREGLKGKFIIIVDNILKANAIPTTADADSRIFLLLEKGAVNLQGDANHVFIYHKESNGRSNSIDLTGTLYSPAAACATNDFNGGKLTYDSLLIQDLTDAGIICQSDGNGGCAPADTSEGEGGSGPTTAAVVDGGKDGYYISMAPQLSVSVETQYEAKESVPAGGNTVAALNPSFIVLPRVIHLPRDPYGTLSDYYNVIPLNGSTLKQEDVSVQCQTGLPTSGNLYSEGVLLDEKVYKCEASATNYAKVPFWVAVSKTLRGTPQVSFVEVVQEMSPTGHAEIHANIPALTSGTKVLIACPDMPEGWSYTMNEDYDPHITSNGTCSFDFGGASGELKLFDINTNAASNGTVVFQLMPSEGYAISSPFTSELHVANLAYVSRVAPSAEDIDAYCETYPEDCPEAGHRGDDEWPNCIRSGTPDTISWVKPSAGLVATVDTNDSWSVSAGGAGLLTLIEDNPIEGCVVIIPMDSNTLSRDTIRAERTYTLRAIAKAKKSSIKVGFTGEVGAGKNPYVVINTDTHSKTCYYDDYKDSIPKACTMDLYNGETVNVFIEKSSGENKNFNYWKCENNGGNTCPTTEPITSGEYPDFTIKDNNAIIYAHFGEVDEHCFFDEFKQGSVECGGENTKYCIDKCGNGANDVCVSAITGGSYANSRWHLVEGSLNDIEDSYECISIDNAVSRSSNRSNRGAVKVMSTTRPGLRGTLKALVQLPMATSSYGKTSANIAKSGFLLHSNAAGTEFLMLNVFANSSGYLEANLCPNGGSENCISTTPKRNGSELSVSPSSMVMVEATLSDSNTLELTVFSGNYYGKPNTYTSSIKLSDLPSALRDRAHEYIGFSMADPNFKIYGIGWSSNDYGADKCWDTYPTVKCSFAAVASGGVVPTGTNVEPWLGHSGWFDSKSCTPEYYYYNGTDACGGQAGTESECPSTGYYFSNDGAGQHGYRDINGVDVKAARAWLSCLNADEQAVAWSAGTETLRAHCGLFWTGSLTECVNHTDFGTLATVGTGLDGTLTLVGSANLRGSKLNISLENPNSNEVEVWLISANATWGADDFASTPVRFTGTSASFDVVEAFATGAQGFDPEHVKQVVVRNHGDYSVTNVLVSAACKNAVGISNCSVSYNAVAGKWEVSADVSNSSKVSSYKVEGEVNSTAVVSATSPSEWAADRATWKITDNPYGSYQGATFEFTASVTNTNNQTFSTGCGSVTIGTTTCSHLSASNIASGADWPAFNFELNECPQGSCDYEIFFGEGTSLSLLGPSDCTTATCSGSGSGSQTRTKSGKAGECTTSGGCSYSYMVRSSNDDKPFAPCTTSFVVRPLLSSSSVVSSSSAPPSSSSAPPSSSSAAGITATCKIFDNNGSSTSSAFTETGNMKLKVTHNATTNTEARFAGTVADWNGSANVDVVKTNESFWLNANQVMERGFTAPVTAGTYTYTISLGGNTLCSATLTTSQALTCSAPAQVPLGDSFTLTGTYSGTSCSKGYTRNMSGTGTEYPGDLACNNLSQSFTVTSTTPGNYNYLIGVDGSPNATCTKTVQVVRTKPTFECKTGLKATIGESNNVIITLKNITQCGGETSNWCHSSITGDDISVQNGINVGDGTVNLGAFTDTGTDGVSKSYTVTLENSIGVSDAQTCSVEFTAGSSNTMVDFVYNGDHYDFSEGTTYEIQSCTGSTNMTCAAAGGGKKLFVDNVEKYETPDWMTIGQYQNMNWQCSVGQIVTVTGGTMRCKMQW